MFHSASLLRTSPDHDAITLGRLQEFDGSINTVYIAVTNLQQQDDRTHTLKLEHLTYESVGWFRPLEYGALALPELLGPNRHVRSNLVSVFVDELSQSLPLPLEC